MLSQKLAQGLEEISKGSTDLTLIAQGQTGELDKEKWCDAYFIHEIQWVFKRYFNRYLNILDISKQPHLCVYMFACACPQVPLCFCYLVHLKVLFNKLVAVPDQLAICIFHFWFYSICYLSHEGSNIFLQLYEFLGILSRFPLKCTLILVVYVIKIYIFSGLFL